MLKLPKVGEEVEILLDGIWTTKTVLHVYGPTSGIYGNAGFFQYGPSHFWGLDAYGWRFTDSRLIIS